MGAYSTSPNPTESHIRWGDSSRAALFLRASALSFVAAALSFVASSLLPVTAYAGPSVDIATSAVDAGDTVLSSAASAVVSAVDPTKPDNFWECLLERLPGSSYSYNTRAIIQACRIEFPYDGPIEKQETYFFGLLDNDTVADCVQKHLSKTDTPDRLAQRAIQQACLTLFPKEIPK